MKYTREVLSKAVSENHSVYGVLKSLGLRLAGGTHSHITRKIKDFCLDTSHFTGRASNRGKNHIGPKLKPNEILIKRNSGARRDSVQLRRALIESGIDYSCVCCGNAGKWQEKELRLQVNHKNRDWLDDRMENLEFLCPNCHSQTEGWCGSKGLSTITLSRPYKEITKQKFIKQKIRKPRPKKGKWPNDAILSQMVMDIPAVEVATIIGVSGSAIKKRCNKLGIKTRPRGYWEKNKCPSGGIADTAALEAVEINIS